MTAYLLQRMNARAGELVCCRRIAPLSAVKISRENVCCLGCSYCAAGYGRNGVEGSSPRHTLNPYTSRDPDQAGGG